VVPRLSVLEGVGSGDAATREGGVIDIPHPDASARARFARRGPFNIDALRWWRGAPDVPPGTEDASLAFQLVEHIGWLADGADDVDPSDVVKQVSFLHAGDSVTGDEFRAQYRHHVEVARRHMPSLWQYVQYDVKAVGGTGASGAAQGIVAVSVLWFRSTDDFLNRYFASQEDQAAFRAQETFLDLSKAFTFVASSHPSAGPADLP
jgi:hypothetical protein